MNSNIENSNWQVVAIGMLFVLASAIPGSAEYRVALLIENHDYKNSEERTEPVDLEKLKRELQRFGFECRVSTNLLNDREIQREIESLFRTSPTRSTVFIYYRGKVSPKLGFLGTDSRSDFSLEKMFQAMQTLGGSHRRLLCVDSRGGGTVSGIDQNNSMPRNFQLSKGDFKQLVSDFEAGKEKDFLKILGEGNTVASTLAANDVMTGVGSTAISPPSRFVQGKKAGDEWVNASGIVFCWCPPGEFVMGSPESLRGRYPDEEQKKVVIREGFWLSKYELTLGQRIGGRGPGRTTLARMNLDPVTMINHDDARSMTRSLTQSDRKKNRLAVDWQYCLPSEQQWEYAARAGTNSVCYFGEPASQLSEHANFADRSYFDSGDIYSNYADRNLTDGYVKLAPVGSFLPNPWGFHDMYGNVAEWCNNLSVRGGSWASPVSHCRSAYRDRYGSRNQQNFIGYRIAIQKNSPSPSKN